MPCSAVLRLKRAFVSVLLSLAVAYGVAPDINRDSDDDAILQAYRRVVKKVHPDKGGNKKKFQALQGAKEEWDKARQAARPAGNPELSGGKLVPSNAALSARSAQSRQYRISAQAVLPTCCGKWSLPLWAAFVAWVRSQLAPWTVRSWCGHWLGRGCLGRCVPEWEWGRIPG